MKVIILNRFIEFLNILPYLYSLQVDKEIDVYFDIEGVLYLSFNKKKVFF